MAPKRLNPCELEIDIFCKGLRIDESCDLVNDARHFSRTRRCTLKEYFRIV